MVKKEWEATLFLVLKRREVKLVFDE